ncbi:hypothetical protein GpartN1_g3880.t1 [Galdieria partita]|uniref:Uncharacterized protein n=1 Tax=Galdieria partita TaxID=83374 RepID=A0A9C7PX01_9RHOD|nr:hypothetical protein GpartN1_g3880.t1 [Galdieria partita]
MHDQRRDLLQSVENTRSSLASLLNSTSKLLYLASKRSPDTSSGGVEPNSGDNEGLHKAFREEVTHLQQLVEHLVRNFVQAIHVAEEHQQKVEQRDFEDSARLQQLSERLNELSRQVWERERKLEQCKRLLRSFRHSIELPNT